MPFNGFISYSHAADGRLAPAVQRGLHRLAKPWHRRRALWVFRDQTGLAVTPGLWSSIQEALDGSEWFVLLASPEAAQSRWVNREIEHWVATKPADRILPVVTDGEWAWDPTIGDFSADSSAVPLALRGVFSEEPLFLDLRWARNDQQLNLRHSRFRDAIAQLAAPMHGISKDDLEGEDVRQHRLVQRLRAAAVTTVVVLGLVASLAGVVAVRNGQQATAAAAEVVRQQGMVAEQKGHADKFAEQARVQQANARTQEKRAKDAAAETKRQEENARKQAANALEQQGLADQAEARAGQQERLAQQQRAAAEDAAGDAKRQKQLALEQERLAQQAKEEARRQKQLAAEQLALADEAKKEAERQKRAAEEQQRRADAAKKEAEEEKANAEQQQRIAIGRQLFNQANATVEDDAKTALMLGLAAQAIQPATEASRDLTSLVTSTHYAGTLPEATVVAYGSDDVVAVGSADGDFDEAAVSLWDVADRANPVRLATVNGLNALLSSLAFSPDGRTLAGTDEVGKGILWDVTDRTRPIPLAALPDTYVNYVAFSPDGHTLGIGEDGATSLWDVTDRTRPTRLSELTDDDSEAHGEVVFSPDGRTVVTRASPTIVWDISDRAHPSRLATLGCCDGSPASVAFSPDGTVLATGGIDKGPVGNTDPTVMLWDMRDRTRPQRSATLTVGAAVTEVAFSPDGRVLAFGDGRGTTTLWDVASPSKPLQLISMPGHAGSVSSMAFSPDGRTLVSAGSGAMTATLWNVAERGAPEPRSEITDHHGHVMAMTYSPDGRSLATASQDGTATVWGMSDPAHPVRRATLPYGGNGYDGGVVAAFSPDGNTVASAGYDGRVTLTDLTEPTKPAKLATIDEGVTWMGPMKFSPDGRTLGVSALDDGLLLYDLSDRAHPTRLGSVTGLGQTVESVAFSPDGHTVAVSGMNQTLALWSLADRSNPVRVAALTGHGGSAGTAFSPDGRTLATWTFDTVILWDVTDPLHPHQLTTLPGHSGSVHFSPDKRTLATWSGRTGMLWDVSDRTHPYRLTTLTSPSTGVSSVAFSPDGRTLATTNDTADGLTVAVWDYTKLNELRADPVTPACAIAGRGLTAEEWPRYVPDLPYRPTCTE